MFCVGGFPGGSDGEESACKAGDLSSIPGLERSPREGHGNPLLCIYARRIPCTEEPGRLWFMGSQRIKHNWTTKHTFLGKCKKPPKSFDIWTFGWWKKQQSIYTYSMFIIRVLLFSHVLNCGRWLLNSLKGIQHLHEFYGGMNWNTVCRMNKCSVLFHTIIIVIMRLK